MARPPRIWFRKDRRVWMVTIDGQRHNLGNDKRAAEKKFHALMASENRKQEPGDLAAVELMDKFLLWTRGNRSQGTFDWYTKKLQSFLDSLPNQRVAAIDIRPFHVTDWVQPHWSKSYQRGAMQAVQRAFRWACAQGYLKHSPLQHLEKPTAERRDNCPTEADYKAMLRHVNDCYRDLLEFVWETGCRPQEVMSAEVRHFKGNRIEFPVAESKGKKQKRVIYLTDKARKLVEGKKTGRLFLNSRGNPWNAEAINCRMCRLAKKTGHKFALYDLRHAFATRMLEAGLGHITVAKLMGHSDPSMLAKVYQHIGEKNDFLLEQLRSVS